MCNRFQNSFVCFVNWSAHTYILMSTNVLGPCVGVCIAWTAVIERMSALSFLYLYCAHIMYDTTKSGVSFYAELPIRSHCRTLKRVCEIFHSASGTLQPSQCYAGIHPFMMGSIRQGMSRSLAFRAQVWSLPDHEDRSVMMKLVPNCSLLLIHVLVWLPPHSAFCRRDRLIGWHVNSAEPLATSIWCVWAKAARAQCRRSAVSIYICPQACLSDWAPFYIWS